MAFYGGAQPAARTYGAHVTGTFVTSKVTAQSTPNSEANHDGLASSMCCIVLFKKINTFYENTTAF